MKSHVRGTASQNVRTCSYNTSTDFRLRKSELTAGKLQCCHSGCQLIGTDLSPDLALSIKTSQESEPHQSSPFFLQAKQSHPAGSTPHVAAGHFLPLSHTVSSRVWWGKETETCLPETTAPTWRHSDPERLVLSSSQG